MNLIKNALRLFSFWRWRIFAKGTNIRSAAEIDLQPKVLDDIEDLYLKRRELEDRIRNVDLLNQLRIEKALCSRLRNIERMTCVHLTKTAPHPSIAKSRDPTELGNSALLEIKLALGLTPAKVNLP